MTEHRRLLRSTSIISIITILSRILGYVRDSRIAFLLGAGNLADAFTIAYRIPNLLRRLVGEGAVSAAFIPVFSRYLIEGDRKKAWEFANALLTVTAVFATVIAVSGIVFSPWIVPLFASGFSVTPGKLETTAFLNRILFPYVAFVSLSALIMGILNSFHRFAAPALAPVLLNVSIISFSLVAGLFSSPAIALAAGVVVGGILQISIQIPSLVRQGWTFRWIWNLAHPGVRRVASLTAPLLFGVGIVQINVLVGSQFASYMPTGSVTSIYLADRITELVLGAYAIALSTAILPLFARQAAEGRTEEMKGTINFAVRIVLFVTIPAAVGLILLRTPIVEVLFEHGKFDAASTQLTTWALPFFAVGLPAFSTVKIVVPAFYAMQDTRTPVWIAFFAMLVNVGLNLLFFRPLGNGGPGLATSLAATFNAVALLFMFRRRYGRLGARAVGVSCMKFVTAALIMGMIAAVVIHAPGFYAGRLAQRGLALGLTIAFAAATFFGAAYVLRTSELGEVRRILRPNEGLDETSANRQTAGM